MFFRGTIGATQVVGSLRPASLALMFDDTESLTYDRAGRLFSRWVEGRKYRRALDGRVLEKQKVAGRRHRRWLERDEIASLIAESVARVRGLLDRVVEECVSWDVAPELEGLVEVLRRAARFDPDTADRDRARFPHVYDPIGILPPDQYMSLVLQATTGCSFDTCTFCELYAGQRFQIKSEQDFREHVRAVREFLGDSILLRRSVFLGEANALVIPCDRLAPLLSIAREELGPLPVHAFVDAFSGQRKSLEEYRHLAELGLRRVSIGLETGHDPLLEFVQKPARARDAMEAVATLKAAGLAVNLIVLVGLGGDRFGEQHVADTVAALEAMPLERGDIVYFSELLEQQGTRYSERARATGIRPLTEAESRAQRDSIRDRIQLGRDGPRLAKYDLREFVY